MLSENRRATCPLGIRPTGERLCYGNMQCFRKETGRVTGCFLSPRQFQQYARQYWLMSRVVMGELLPVIRPVLILLMVTISWKGAETTSKAEQLHFFLLSSLCFQDKGDPFDPPQSWQDCGTSSLFICGSHKFLLIAHGCTLIGVIRRTAYLMKSNWAIRLETSSRNGCKRLI